MFRHAKPEPEPEGYVSEFTRFMTGFLEKHPEVVEEQRKGWYIYWDHHVGLDELEEKHDTVPIFGYPYYSWGKPGRRH
jgi:hypothetical protein